LNAGQAGEREEGVPVSWLSPKDINSKFANRPHAAGMGPGYKKPSQNIQKTSHAIVLVRKGMGKTSLFLHIECKSGGIEYHQARFGINEDA
jgi:hypothetical protein